MASKNVHIDDRVWRKLQKKLAKASKAHVRVGLLQEKGSQKRHAGSPFTIAEIGAVHEFGTKPGTVPKIPERSYIRRTFIKKQVELAKKSAQLAKLLIVDKSRSTRSVLTLLGQWGAAQVKNTITQGESIPPPLKPSSIASKVRPSTRALIDTGQLVNSISYVVKDKK